MRRTRLVNLLMLLLLAMTASGVGRALHDRFAHAHDRQTASLHDTSPVTAQDHDEAPADPHPASAHHECQTCALLSSLANVILTIAMALLVGAALVQMHSIAPQIARLTIRLPALPNRGPPALA